MARRIRRRDRNPVTFTPRVKALLYAAVKAGLPYKRACEICGVSYRNFSYWMNRGKEGPDWDTYVCFRRYIKRIEARKEKELLEVIDKVAVGNYKVRETEITFSESKGRTFKRKTKIIRPEWKAAAWRLERKYREDYAPALLNADAARTPEEIAEGIRQASQMLEQSVPTEEEEAA